MTKIFIEITGNLQFSQILSRWHNSVDIKSFMLQMKKQIQ